MAFTYRIILLFWTLVSTIPLVIFFFVWQAVFQEKDLIGSYTFGSMISYYVAVRFISQFVNNESITEEIGREIREGLLTNYLLRSISHIVAKLVGVLAFKIISMALAIPLLALLFFWLKEYLIFPKDFSLYGLLAIVMVVSFALNFLIFYCVSLFSFWLIQPRGLLSIINMIFMRILAGVVFPIDLLPNFITNINRFLPFQFLFYFPAKIALGQVARQDILKGLVIELVWIIIFYFLIQYIWKKGLKIYEGVGI